MTGIEIQPNTTVLVLNASYEPLNFCSWRRAVVLLLKEKAQFLSSRVIRLLNYIRIPFSALAAHKPSRSAIYKRDGYKCAYCSSTRNLTVDHILPKSRGGENSWTNLAAACESCNVKKGNRTPEECGMVLKIKPQAPSNKLIFYMDVSKVDEWKQYSFT